MSRTLDFDNLSQDDLAYIAQREILQQEITATTGKDPLEGYSRDVDPLAEFDRPNESGTIVAGSATVGVPGNLNVNNGTPVGESEEDAGGEWDEDMKKADLQAAIDARNEGRSEDDQIVPEGTTKADLIAALEADDEDSE